ncbi:MAG: hypothetical protein ACHQFW_07340 [Chitinophagales bacterium]
MTKPFVFIFLFIVCIVANAQYNSSMDPRKYIEIYESARGSDSDILIWSWNNSIQNPTKKYLIDKNSTLRIKFKIDEMIADENIIGGFSLGARVNDRNIEVEPYYITGKEKSAIGFPVNLSAEVLTTEFYNLFLKFFDIYEGFYVLYSDSLSDYEIINTVVLQSGNLKAARNYLEEFNSFYADDTKSQILVQMLGIDQQTMVALMGNMDTLMQKIDHIENTPRTDESDFDDVDYFIKHYTGTYYSIYSYITSFYKQSCASRGDNENSTGVYVVPEDVKCFKENIKRIIYSRLVDGNISLSALDINPNDVVRIYLIWNNAKGINTSENYPIELPIGEFTVRNLGFYGDISESILFIKRVEQPLTPETSPSNFKPAPGFNLLLNYGGSKYGNNGVFTFLKPSIGINVSLIDFDTTENSEMGAGFVLGLFNNQVFANAGWNLNVPTQPFYWSLGFSFINAVQTVTEVAGGNTVGDRNR